MRGRMGLNLNMSLLLREWIARYEISGPLLTLGVQTLDFTQAQFARARGLPAPEANAGAAVLPPQLFKACGINETLSLDVSDYEGADFICDLNCPEVPDALVSRFGCILNGGTLEHVFHIPNALASITRMLKLGGVVIHQIPVHNWVDHGFYQINPTLLFDYYGAAQFEILESAGLLFNPAGGDLWEIIPVPPGAFGSGLCGGLDERALLCLFAARKTAAAMEHVTPMQSLYAGNPVKRPRTLRWFPPFAMQDGIPTKPIRRKKIVLGPYTREQGLAWVTALPADLIEGDTPKALMRSPMLLFEDGAALGPPHTMHDIIRRFGGGAYSHWGKSLLFSTSDDSDPNTNGRTYIATVADRSQVRDARFRPDRSS